MGHPENASVNLMGLETHAREVYLQSAVHTYADNKSDIMSYYIIGLGMSSPVLKTTRLLCLLLRL